MFKRFLAQLVDRIVNNKRYSDTKKLLRQPRCQQGLSSLFDFPFHYVDAGTFYYGYQEIFKDEAYKFDTTTAVPYIIDCGANIGLSTVYFKKLYPPAKVVSFEADPQIFETLRKNIEINKLTGVEPVNKAVWINNEFIEFEVEGGFSGRINKYSSERNLIKVPAIRLKDLLTENVDFLKLDIEGAEFEVIKDCGENLKYVKHLFIEYHSHKNESQKLGELLSMFSDNGFRYHIKEAYTVKHPFVQHEDMLGMDLQLNIYAINQLNV
jgi:FkbM family methyltransferase